MTQCSLLASDAYVYVLVDRYDIVLEFDASQVPKSSLMFIAFYSRLRHRLINAYVGCTDIHMIVFYRNYLLRGKTAKFEASTGKHLAAKSQYGCER